MTHLWKSARRYRVVPAIVAITALTVISHYVGTVWGARVNTPELVRSALSSGWIDMRASDLSAWQKCALLTVQDPGFYEHSTPPLNSQSREHYTHEYSAGSRLAGGARHSAEARRVALLELALRVVRESRVNYHSHR